MKTPRAIEPCDAWRGSEFTAAASRPRMRSQVSGSRICTFQPKLSLRNKRPEGSARAFPDAIIWFVSGGSLEVGTEAVVMAMRFARRLIDRRKFRRCLKNTARISATTPEDAQRTTANFLPKTWQENGASWLVLADAKKTNRDNISPGALLLAGIGGHRPPKCQFMPGVRTPQGSIFSIVVSRASVGVHLHFPHNALQ